VEAVGDAAQAEARDLAVSSGTPVRRATWRKVRPSKSASRTAVRWGAGSSSTATRTRLATAAAIAASSGLGGDVGSRAVAARVA
jgi:hypothetical protein